MPGAVPHRLLPDDQIDTTSLGWKPMELRTTILKGSHNQPK
jgi:hypothetical protein